MEKKETRGGKRKGAGRPKSKMEEDAKRYTLWLSIPDMDIVKKKTKSTSEFVREAIKEKIEREINLD